MQEVSFRIRIITLWWTPWSWCFVVNALSTRLEIQIKRNSKQYEIAFSSGKIVNKLKHTGSVGQRNTGTLVKFWPDKKIL